MDGILNAQGKASAQQRACAFNPASRLADAFGFGLLTPEGCEAGARYLLKRGYR